MSKLSYLHNEPIAKAGRAVVISSSVLFLQQFGVLEIDKLPFVGASINGDKVTIGLFMFLVSTYYLYKFYVYNKSEDVYFSRRDELLEANIEHYFNRYGAKLSNNLKRAILSGDSVYMNSSLDGILSPTRNDGERYRWITRYNLAELTFDGFTEFDAKDIYIRVKTDSSYRIKLFMNFAYVYSDSSGSGSYLSSSTVICHEFDSKKYLNVYRQCYIKSYLSLPDFLEKHFPYLFFVFSFTYYIFP
ncbi:hypothetical protein ACJO1Y_04515 [Vibrio parahaemolyticus]|uniref:hypothetical protein n=1 Tax=Vibrio harveyi group TaxID=717610 RepID=UPI00280A23A6|nr:hypothetical protein [Vibrio parahaemolyticus]EIU6861657.1 hypothetical protein [Vibrio parahaemolyticus]EIU7062212.1 hypothetical protein [Vibrio parahaemolyticus]ELA7931215.1 hypothetical protein [Vibrio parahaemolyticus]HCE3302591.1 hypothetical protein [Vibrio parahaemolyticus]